MTRVKRGVAKNKKRKSLLSMTKGYRHGRKSKIRLAKTAVRKAGVYAFNHRKQKKQNMRRGWQNTMNYALRELGLKYSTFIDTLKKKDIKLDRKIISELVKENPDTFKRLVESVSVK